VVKTKVEKLELEEEVMVEIRTSRVTIIRQMKEVMTKMILKINF
jgi:hypothetical protein